MKRFLKWVRRLLAVLVLVPVLGLLGFWAIYASVVWPKPGGLAVPVAPGERGARVDPFIATGGFSWMSGHDTPAATTPFGMVRLGPDTASIFKKTTGYNRSGYFYGDNKIIGFSHTRLVGADALEGGIFRVFPTVESRAKTVLRKDERYAKFSHKAETAFPGYYAVDLPQDRVRVELTATPRVGVHRYTFKKGEQPHLLLEVTSALGGRGRETGAATVLLGANEVVGRVTEYGSFSGRYDGLDAFFVARFSRPFAGFGTWEGDRFSPGATEVEGKNIGVDLAFEVPAGQPAVVEARVAISYVSVANARMNLEAEAASRTFEEVFAGARDAWEKQLSVIDVQGGTERQQRIFYTSLYHAFVMPTVFNDVNDEYKGFDKETHKAEGFRYFTDISLWDTFRTVQPLYNLIARADQRDIMVSLVEMAKAGGCLPRWPSGAGYTNCMFGTPADVAVSEAYQKGIRDFDIETAYGKMRETALTGKPEGSKFAGREGLEGYLEYGYCPSDEMKRESVACTLEFGWADYAIAQLARELGRAEDAELFAKRAQGYKNLWNPETLFFEGRDTKGSFPEERNPRVLTYTDFGNRYASAYVEGSGWQWRWAVPYDPQGLISLFPNREYFVEQLEEFLENTRSRLGWWNPGPYYWHGNEHDIHAAYLFNEAGRPDLTQKWVRRILETKYSDDYVGLDGNDDGGTLSAWYVLSALGFYPIAGTTRYELGSPLFDAAELRIDGKVLKIVAENNGPDNVYVQQVWLNDAPLDRTWFTHDEIAEGGTLRFKMGPAPSAAKPAA